MYKYLLLDIDDTLIEYDYSTSYAFNQMLKKFKFKMINENNKEVSQTDLKAVNDMYKTIFDEINNIGKETGVLPQILIVDHVDGNDLEIKDEFLSYVRKDWRNGEALI